MNRPLPIAFVLFMAGIVFAHRLPIPFPVVIGLIALFIILLLFFRNRRDLIFYVISGSLVLLLAAAVYLNYNNLPANHISYLLKDRDCFAPSGLAMTVEGVIVSSPDYRWTRWSKRRCSFLLKASSYKKGHDWVKIEGLSRVNIKDNQLEYSYGDTIVISGRLKEPSRPRNPGQFDYAGYLKTERIHTLIEVRSDQDITPLEGKSPLILKKLIFNQRANIERLIKKFLPTEDAAILNAMLIGKREALSEKLKEQFIKTGTAHVLSISGLHVAIISAMAFFFLRLIRIPRKASGILLISFLIIYALFTGARAPILRAVIMITVYLLGYILERDFDIYSALSLAGIIILAINPMQLFNAGFALSFTCVFSICYLTPKLESFFIPLLRRSPQPHPIEKNIITRYLLKLILGSLAVYIGVAPLTGYYFNIVSPITMLANLLIVPLLGVVLFFGILFLIAANFFGPLAAAFSYPVHFILLVFTRIIFHLSGIPFGHFYIGDLPFYAIAIYYIFILLVIKREALGLNRIKIFGIAFLIINIFIWKPFFIKTDQLKVGFLDLGGGLSTFLEFPDGETMLINAGRRVSFYYDQGESIVLPFIWSRGRRSIDYLFLTRSDPAHLGAALSVLKKVRVRYLISGALRPHKDEPYQRFKEFLASKKIRDIRIKEGMQIEGVDEARISLISPSRLKLTYKQVSFLLYPEKGIIQPAEGELQTVYTAGNGAVTIITDGSHILRRPFRSSKTQTGL